MENEVCESSKRTEEGKSPATTHLVNSSHSGEVPMPEINVDVPSQLGSNSVLAFF